jgi:hypothetical protein
MRRSLSSRVFAALFAPWFALVVAEPVPLHDCPVHSVHPVSASAVATAASMMDHAAMDHDGDADMGPSAIELAVPESHHHGSGHAGHHQCCCLGMSCASAFVVMTSPPVLAWIPAEVRRTVSWAPAAAFVPVGADYVLPFGNGPPSVV